MPVYIIATYNEDGSPNAMNATWGSISEVTGFTVRIHAGHKTAQNILARKAFTVSMGTVPQMVACDYVGIVSGNKVPEKFHKAGFHPIPSRFVDAPLIEELPMALECEMVSYDPETNNLVGRIVNVSADACILNEKGKIDVEKLQPLFYEPVLHDYFSLGGKLGPTYRVGMALK
jgi:flavin reductase (DIM6/NTAB) family NADH-FMN oxidoreductase RutF